MLDALLVKDSNSSDMDKQRMDSQFWKGTNNLRSYL